MTADETIYYGMIVGGVRRSEGESCMGAGAVVSNVDLVATSPARYSVVGPVESLGAIRPLRNFDVQGTFLHKY